MLLILDALPAQDSTSRSQNTYEQMFGLDRVVFLIAYSTYIHQGSLNGTHFGEVKQCTHIW